MPNPDGCIRHRVYARVGLLGNPSDGYFGKTISFSLENFYAEVQLRPNDSIAFEQHTVYDSTSSPDLASLVQRIEAQGYYGAVRLLMATCKRFHDYCRQYSIPLEDKKFALSYDTNIPRQAGLSGSSSIVCAALSCLMEYFGVADRIPLVERPALVLSAEQELGITAGLQDRVIQVYGGVVYMDFDQQYMAAHGHGQYIPLDPSLLPRLWLVYCETASDSGKVHSNVRQRWLAGDEALRQQMTQVAECAARGRTALEARDLQQLAELMNRNFDLRRQMFGDAALGDSNLRMIATARSVGAAAKLTGSGGAIVAFCPDGEGQERLLQERVAEEGFSIIQAVVAPAQSQ